MKKTVKQLLSGILTLLLLCSFSSATLAEGTETETGAPAAATGEAAAQTAGENNPAPGDGTEDSGIIDAEALQQWMDGFAQEHDLKQDYKRFSVGFWYSGTGDFWYYDADKWMYSASLYKVPVSMLMAEKEAAGELSQDSVVNGTSLEYLESTALVYSNNDSGHSMVSWLGGTYAGKCSDMTIKFTDLPDSYFDQDFYDVSYYTARYMTQVMSTVYQGGEEKFPHVLDYLKQAQPNDYFNRDSFLQANYTIAQKFGAYEEANGNNNNHCAAVIYTPNPIVVTVMTRNVGDYQNIIAAVGAHLAETALELDGKLDAWKQAEVDRIAAEQTAAVQAEAERLAAEQAAGQAATESSGAEAQSASMPAADGATAAETPAESGVNEAVPAVQGTGTTEIPGGADTETRKLPTAVIVIALILVVTAIVAAALLYIMRRRDAESDEEDVLTWADFDLKEERHRHTAAARHREVAGNTDRTTSANKRTESDGAYRPRH